MSWSWQMLHDDGTAAASSAATPPSAGFPTQGDAETWIGEVWRDLLADGVDAVALHEEGRRVYGPMSLHPTT